MNTRALQKALEALMDRHGVALAPLTPLPLATPSAHSLRLVGVASPAGVVDRDRTMIMPRALTWSTPLPPLRFEHGPVAGELLTLDYAADGSLLAHAEVHHETARRAPAFSIAATVSKFTLHDVDTPHFYAAIHRAELVELSLTTTPHNSLACVQHRYPVPAQVEFYSLMQRRILCLQKSLRLIQEHA